MKMPATASGIFFLNSALLALIHPRNLNASFIIICTLKIVRNRQVSVGSCLQKQPGASESPAGILVFLNRKGGAGGEQVGSHAERKNPQMVRG